MYRYLILIVLTIKIQCYRLTSDFKLLSRSTKVHEGINEDNVGDLSISTPNLLVPKTILGMITESASSILEARKNGLPLVSIEFPLPITGGTEVDDWPGGIKQKYNTLRPLLVEMMKLIKFSPSEINKTDFLGEFGEEDAVGLWQNNDIRICCFPTSDSINALRELQKWSDTSTTTVIVIPQFFLNRFSKEESKKYVDSIEVIICLLLDIIVLLVLISI
jgi:hypothetical protein